VSFINIQMHDDEHLSFTALVQQLGLLFNILKSTPDTG